MTLASLVTVVRLALVPIFAILLTQGDPRALPLFVAIALGDVLDGLLARTISRPSRLGAVLDAAADKVLMTVTFVLGAIAGILPVWLSVIVVGRDVLQSGVWLILVRARKHARDPILWEPSRVGKYSTVFQAVAVIGGLRAALIDGTAAGPLVRSWMVLTFVLTLVAGIQYTLRAIRQIRRAALNPEWA